MTAPSNLLNDDTQCLCEVLCRDRRCATSALELPSLGRFYTYRDLITTSYKAGNVLRYMGVQKGDSVFIQNQLLPEPILAFLGAAHLGAVTTFGVVSEMDDSRAAVINSDSDIADMPFSNRQEVAVYDGKPTVSRHTHWESEVWSENPAVHPVAVQGGDGLFQDTNSVVSHGSVIQRATQIGSTVSMKAGKKVLLSGSLQCTGVVVSGIIAPLLSGATIVIGGERADADFIVTNQEPRPRRIE
jgi:acyl-CoA synthetase (AMP-forming)/AMP-acid ligase II